MMIRTFGAAMSQRYSRHHNRRQSFTE
jgi:uncharacterized membrane protein YsdA (DUF1294 family)